MGSWYETCGLSNLPIVDGDPVRLVIMRYRNIAHRDGHWGSGFCYPTDLWTPVLALKGTYGDYGRLAEPKLTQWARCFLLSEGLDPDNETLNAFLQSLEGGANLKHGRVFFHEDIWKSIHGVAVPPGAVKSYFRAQGRQYLRQLRASFDVLQIHEAEKALYSIPFDDRFIENPIARAVAMKGDFGCDLAYVQLWLFERFTRAVKIDPFFPLIDQISQLVAVDAAMSRLRKFWSPQCGAGNQEDDIDSHLVLGNAIRHHITKHRRRPSP